MDARSAVGALRSAATQGTKELICAVRDLQGEAIQVGVLWLWEACVAGSEMEYGRILAIVSKEGETSAHIASRLWLMDQAWEDLGVATTLLGALETEAAETAKWPPFLGGELLLFLRRCLCHQWECVRATALSALTLAAQNDMIASLFPPAIAVSLAERIKSEVVPILDDDEIADLDLVVAHLSEASATSLPLAPRSLTRVVLDLEDRRDQFGDLLPNLGDLIKFVQRRALLDDAGQRAAQEGQPIQTLRVLAEKVSNRVVQAFAGFSEAVVGTSQRPQTEATTEDPLPDLTVDLAWAPRASVPIHLVFPEREVRNAFAILEALTDARRRRPELDALWQQIDPTVAESLARLISQIEQSGGDAEITLTDPESPDWQKTVTIGPDVLGRHASSGLLRQSREATRDRGQVIVQQAHVPQANTVAQVFQAVDAMMERGVITQDDIAGINSVRQVNYYRQGARVLGFFDEDNYPTERARALIGQSHRDRLAITSVFFEDSPIGRGWRKWAGEDRLKDVDPATAEEFLVACVPGLSGSTPPRRASTLRTWFAELMPLYPFTPGD